MRKRFFTAAMSLMLALTGHAQIPGDITEKDIERANELVSKMTLDEKISLISGNEDGMSLRPVKRLGIPALQMHDGPQGIGQGIKGLFFPCGMLTAATWEHGKTRRRKPCNRLQRPQHRCYSRSRSERLPCHTLRTQF